ncbi:MAG: leucyl/phenylalanyl-tRNA--protein transferase [Pararhodobacter sp.]|nr:leucyl/phenylalanyl-tRNA--protein transferase [Pararhodobacter sp.]
MELTPRLLLTTYQRGIFPMAESADDDAVFWVEPRRRGIIPLRNPAAPPFAGGGFHASRSLQRSLRRGSWHFSCDQAFSAVVAGCAERPQTWINAPIRRVFEDLHALGHAHSIEVWDKGGALVGGLYGLALGGAFFAESKFSQRADASKLALAELVARLESAGFALLDTQYLTPHLARLGGIEISRGAFRMALAAAIDLDARHELAFSPRNPDAASGGYALYG